MTDKVQKIREEVEKRYEYWKEKESNSHSIESEIRMSECQHLLLMLNSLQEEHVSDDFEMALTEMIDKAQKCVVEPIVVAQQWKDYLVELAKSEEPVSEEWIKELRTKLDSMSKEDFKKVFDKYAVDFNEEPISEELEEAAIEYCGGNKGSDARVRGGFLAGAKWQKEQFEKDYTNLCKGIATAKGLAVAMAYDKGVADTKEQMIEKLRVWVKSHNDRDCYTFGYIDKHFDELLKQIMKDE